MFEQWIDPNGRNWLHSDTDLYRLKSWRFADENRRDGYSIVLFPPRGGRHWSPSRSWLRGFMRTERAISSIQSIFEPGRAAALHVMPPGGFRLAIVNGRDQGRAHACVPGW